MKKNSESARQADSIKNSERKINRFNLREKNLNCHNEKNLNLLNNVLEKYIIQTNQYLNSKMFNTALKKPIFLFILFFCLLLTSGLPILSEVGEGLTAQSPINIITSKAVLDPNSKELEFVNYGSKQTWNVTNNGETIKFVVANSMEADNLPYFNNKNTQSSYVIQNFRFHWGVSNSEGSEHQIDSQVFPLELHLVHKSSNGAFSVLGILFTVNIFFSIIFSF